MMRSRPWCNHEHAPGVFSECERPWVPAAVGAVHRAFLNATLPHLDAACQGALQTAGHGHRGDTATLATGIHPSPQGADLPRYDLIRPVSYPRHEGHAAHPCTAITSRVSAGGRGRLAPPDGHSSAATPADPRKPPSPAGPRAIPVPGSSGRQEPMILHRTAAAFIGWLRRPLAVLVAAAAAVLLAGQPQAARAATGDFEIQAQAFQTTASTAASGAR